MAGAQMLTSKVKEQGHRAHGYFRDVVQHATARDPPAPDCIHDNGSTDCGCERGSRGEPQATTASIVQLRRSVVDVGWNSPDSLAFDRGAADVRNTHTGAGATYHQLVLTQLAQLHLWWHLMCRSAAMPGSAASLSSAHISAHWRVWRRLTMKYTTASYAATRSFKRHQAGAN